MSGLIGERQWVLDKGWVELLDMMPHPIVGSADQAVVSGARTSYLGESKGEEADKRLLFRLMRDKHTSPFELVEFKFRIYAPLMVYWQLVRHRTFHFMSINSQSGRYTPFEEDAFYVPDEWRKQSASNKQGSDGVVSPELSEKMTEELLKLYKDGFTLYQNALAAGVSKELARVFLPGFSVYYTWVMSIDAWNLLNFFRLRLAPDAQHEIRLYAEAMYENLFKPNMPWTAEAFEEYILAK